jgi:hypothetical protein
MKQQTLSMAADQSFENYRKAGNGRPPIGLERMLRIHFVQHCSTWRIWHVRRRCMTVPAYAVL